MKTLPLSTLIASLLFGTATAQDSINWYATDWIEAMEAAREQDKLIAIYCYRDGHEAAASFWTNTMLDESVQEKLKEEFISFSASADNAVGDGLMKKYHTDTIPAIIVVMPDGSIEDRVLGYWDSEGLLFHLERIQRGEGTVSEARKAYEKDKKDGLRHYELAKRLREVGDDAGFTEIVD